MIQKIVQISHIAGKEIMKYYDEPIDVEHKFDDSPLTKADLAATYTFTFVLYLCS